MLHTEGNGHYRIEELPNGLFLVFWFGSKTKKTFKTLAAARRAAGVDWFAVATDICRPN